MTIKDVARKANVSVATVSRVLNNLGGYTEETRQRVLNVIEETGYTRNAVARGLITKTTSTVGVLVPNVSTLFFAEILNGIENLAHKNNYCVVVCNTGEDGNRTLAYMKVLSERQMDGIIIASLNIKDEHIKAIESLNIPCIMVSTMSYRLQFPYVKVDDRQAAYSATRYLIDKGHRSIAMISGTQDDKTAGSPRVEGYRQALMDFNIPYDEKLVAYGDFGYKSGIRCMEELLSGGRKFTALFAASDDMAVGAMSVAFKNGIAIPDELSVIGYDNTRVAEMSIPPLTSVSQPLYAMGEKAMEKLLIMMKTGKRVESIIMPHEIVERSTVKPV